MAAEKGTHYYEWGSYQKSFCYLKKEENRNKKLKNCGCKKKKKVLLGSENVDIKENNNCVLNLVLSFYIFQAASLCLKRPSNQRDKFEDNFFIYKWTHLRKLEKEWMCFIFQPICLR